MAQMRGIRRVVATLLFGSALATAQAALINIDFNRNSATQSGAGLLGGAGDVWNGVSGGSGSGIALVDASGVASGFTLSYAATASFDVSCPGGSSFCGTPYESLMLDYLYADNGGVGTVTLAGLGANSIYELVLYSSPNLNRQRYTRFTANGLSATASSNGSETTLLEGVNYVSLMTTVDALGQINIGFTNAGGTALFNEGDLNGLQMREITPGQLPEPSTAMLVAAALALIGLKRRRRA